jgi:hypothetical protein
VDNLRWAKASIRGIDRTGAVQSDVKVRTFVENDRAELRDLFRRAGEGAPTASLWGHEESEAAVYLTPYMDLEPDSLSLPTSAGR